MEQIRKYEHRVIYPTFDGVGDSKESGALNIFTTFSAVRVLCVVYIVLGPNEPD